jgi:hypothetical protein
MIKIVFCWSEEQIEPWVQSDLWGACSEVDDNYVQFALAGVIMGDLNAVYAIEEAHRRKLGAHGVLQPQELLMPGKPFPRTELGGNVLMVCLCSV